MNKSPFFLGPDRDLTREELEALLYVKQASASLNAYAKLEIAELIEKGIYGWKLTKAGAFRPRPRGSNCHNSLTG